MSLIARLLAAAVAFGTASGEPARSLLNGAATQCNLAYQAQVQACANAYAIAVKAPPCPPVDTYVMCVNAVPHSTCNAAEFATLQANLAALRVSTKCPDNTQPVAAPVTAPVANGAVAPTVYPDSQGGMCTPGYSCQTGGMPQTRGLCVVYGVKKDKWCWDVCNIKHKPEDYTIDYCPASQTDNDGCVVRNTGFMLLVQRVRTRQSTQVVCPASANSPDQCALGERCGGGSFPEDQGMCILDPQGTGAGGVQSTICQDMCDDSHAFGMTKDGLSDRNIYTINKVRAGGDSHSRCWGINWWPWLIMLFLICAICIGLGVFIYRKNAANKRRNRDTGMAYDSEDEQRSYEDRQYPPMERMPEPPVEQYYEEQRPVQEQRPMQEPGFLGPMPDLMGGSRSMYPAPGVPTQAVMQQPQLQYGGSMNMTVPAVQPSYSMSMPTAGYGVQPAASHAGSQGGTFFTQYGGQPMAGSMQYSR